MKDKGYFSEDCYVFFVLWAEVLGVLMSFFLSVQERDTYQTMSVLRYKKRAVYCVCFFSLPSAQNNLYAWSTLGVADFGSLGRKENCNQPYGG